MRAKWVGNTTTSQCLKYLTAIFHLYAQEVNHETKCQTEKNQILATITLAAVHQSSTEVHQWAVKSVNQL